MGDLRTPQIAAVLLLATGLALLPSATRSSLHAQVSPPPHELLGLRDSMAASRAAPATIRAFDDLIDAQRRNTRSAFDDALRAFDRAIREAPQAPEPRFGRAMTKLAMREHDYMPKAGIGGMISGQSFYESYIRDVSAAAGLERQPGPVAIWLARAAMTQGDRDQPLEVTAMLRRLSQSPRATADGWLALARQQRLLGDDRAALQSLNAFVQLGGDSSVGTLEAARALAGLDQLDSAAVLYLRGLEGTSDAGLVLYRRDLAWIASAEELAEFDSTAPAARAAWVRNWFLLRDAEDIRLPGERLRDHLRRWVFVHRYFRTPNPERWSAFLKVIEPPPGRACSRGRPDDLDPVRLANVNIRAEDARQDEVLLDHRAVIYMRHGEPAVMMGFSEDWRDSTSAAREASLTVSGDKPRAATASVWVYWIQGHAAVFSFGPTLPRSKFGPRALSLVPITYAPLLWMLGQNDPVYLRAAHRIQNSADGGRSAVPVACLPAMQSLAIRAERDALAGATTDSYAVTFTQALDPVLQVTPVGNPSRGTGRLLVIFAAPGDRLAPTHTWPSGVSYQLRVRVSALDRDHGTVSITDTVRQFVSADSLGPGEYLSGHLEVPLPAGVYDVGVLVALDRQSTGGWQKWRGIRLGSPTAALAMSGIVLAKEADGLRWDNFGDPVLLNALDAYTVGAEVPIYYEVNGMRRGDAYRTTVAVIPTGGRARTTRVSFVEEATASVAHVRRAIGLGELRPGQHELVVTVEHLASGARTEMRRTINLVRQRPSP